MRGTFIPSPHGERVRGKPRSTACDVVEHADGPPNAPRQVYPRRDIDKAREHGETWAVDPELRDALNQLAADLRSEIRSGDAETRAYIDERMGTSAAETRAYIDERVGTSAAETRAYIDERVGTSAAETRAYIDERVGTSAAETRAYIDGLVGTSAAETRRHFDVVGESLRGEIRALAEAMTLNNEGTHRRFGEETVRTGRLESRVTRLEARVMILEDSRKPPKRRRQQ